MKTRAETEHGTSRPDQNTNARSCPKQRGRAGRCKAMRKRASWVRKARPKWHNRRRSTARVARQVCGVMLVLIQEERIITPKYVRGYRPYRPKQRKKPEAHSGTYSPCRAICPFFFRLITFEIPRNEKKSTSAMIARAEGITDLIIFFPFTKIK